VKLTELRENSVETAQLTIYKDQEEYWVRPSVSYDHLWQVVRFGDALARGLVLRRDQVIRLGKVPFRVREVRSGSESPLEAVSDLEACEEGDFEGVAEGNVCKMCSEGEKDRGNPLLLHCKCQESAQFIHFLCLKDWISSKVTIRRKRSFTSYQWKTLECDFCKAELPFSLTYHATSLNLYDFPPPEPPYIVLEAWEDNKRAPNAIFILSMAEGSSIRLGRGRDSDIRVNDISVSRCHALIRLSEGEFLLEDNSSKFGSLVQVTAPVPIPSMGKVALQAGRSLVLLCQGPSELRQCGVRDLIATRK